MDYRPTELTMVSYYDTIVEAEAPRCDYQWRLLEEESPLAQWRYGKDDEHGWPYPVT